MTYLHLAFGMCVQSNRRLPGLPVLAADESPDIYIDLNMPWRDPGSESNERLLCEFHGYSKNGPPILRVWKRTSDGRYRFRYEDGTEFTVDSSGSRIGAAWPEPLTLEDASTYLMGPVLGFILRLRGMVCLHASAVVIENKAVALLAPPGFGKSTLAALFARWGHPVLSDDIVALVAGGDRLLVEPAFPRIHLWPSAVEALFGSSDALPRVSPHNRTWDKRYLSLCGGGYKFQKTPVPLAAIYTGRYREDQQGYHIEGVTGHRAFSLLAANSYTWYLLDREMRVREFEVLCSALSLIPLRSIRARSREEDSLASLGRAILEDFRGG